MATSKEAAGGSVELLIDLLKLAAIISRPMQEEVADPHGLSINELRTLMCLAGEGALAGQDIARIMSIAPMNVSRALAALDRRGWTTPVANPGNRRRRPVCLSEAGWRAYHAIVPDIRSVARRLFASLARQERGRLDDVLTGLIARIEAWDIVPGAED